MADISTDNATQETQDEIVGLKEAQADKEKAVKDNLVKSSDPYDKYANTIINQYAKPANAEALINRDSFQKVYGDKYLQQFNGDKSKAKSAMDQQYEIMSQGYQKQAEDESNFKILDNMAYMARGIKNVQIIGSEYSPDIYESPETISGRRQVMGNWTDPTQTSEQVALKNKKVLDYKGDIIEYKDKPYGELSNNDDYTDDKGNKIIGFEYLPSGDEFSRNSDVPIKAIYEGQLPHGELVSRLDSSNSFLSSNGIDNSWWKVGVGSVFDFVVDTIDAAAGLVQYATPMAGLSYLAGKISPDVEDINNKIFSGISDFRTHYLKSYLTSKSKEDKESTITFNNTLSMGINLAAMLLTGKAIASGVAKLVGVGVESAEAIFAAGKELEAAQTIEAAATTAVEKATASTTTQSLLSKYEALSANYNKGSNIVKKVSLFAMGAMQAKATGDAAGEAGFSPAQQSMIYFASLGTMSIASKLADLGFERLGIQNISPIINRTAKESIEGIVPDEQGVSKIFAKTVEISNGIRNKVEKLLDSHGVMAQGARAGLEQEAIYTLDQLVRHTATGLAHLGYDANPPKFKTMFDEGYWSDFAKESVMQLVSGGLGGIVSAGGERLMGVKPEQKMVSDDKLPQKGTAAEVMKQIGYYSTKTEKGAQWYNQFVETLGKQRKNGSGGREDISTKWDTSLNRYKRVNELTDADKLQGYSSQAETQYVATLAQLEYYKHIYDNTAEKFETIKDQDPTIGLLMNSPTMFEETRKLYDEKAKIYVASSSKGNIDFDNKLRDIKKAQDKIKVDKEGNVKDDVYQGKVKELVEVTNLSTSDVERLVKINSQIDDINSGKALENGFIKHFLSGSNFKGRLDFDTVKSLIATDIKGQNNFIEQNKTNLETQKSFDALLKTNRSKNGNLSYEFLKELINNKDNLFLSDETRRKTLLGINLLGNSLDIQKIHFYNKLIPDLKVAIKESLKNPYNITHVNGSQIGEELMGSMIKQIERSSQKGGLSVSRTIRGFKDIVLMPVPENSKIAYILKKLDIISRIRTANGFSEVKYDISRSFDKEGKNPISESDRMNLETLVEGTLQHDLGFNFIGDAHVQDGTDTPSIGKLIDTTKDNFLDELDTHRQDKINLRALVLNSQTHNPEQTRHDLIYGFTKTASNSIITSDETLESQYNRLVDTAIRDDKGNMIFFADADLALKLDAQLDTRIAEAEFLAHIIPTTSKIDRLNKTILNNNKPETTFLSKYIEQYVVKLDNFNTNPEPFYKSLNDTFQYLNIIKNNVQELLKLSAKAGEDFNELYSGKAIMNAKTDFAALKNIWTIFQDSSAFISNEDKQFLQDVNKKLNNIDDFNDTSKEGLIKVYGAIYDLKKTLHNEYIASDKVVLTKMVTALKDYVTDADAKTIFRYMLSPTDAINTLIKASIVDMTNEGVKNPNALVLPTTEQLVWIEEMCTAVINKELLTSVKTTKDRSNGYTSGIFFSGTQGSGKSQVVIKHAAEILQKHFDNISQTENKDEFGGVVRKIAFVSAAENMRDSMLKNIDRMKVKESGMFKTQQDLYDFFVINKDEISYKQMAQKVRDIGAIFFDEISLVEYSGNEVNKSRKNPKDAFVLNAILAQLEKVNEERIGNKLIIIGIGDATQPGYMAGTSSPRNPEPFEAKIESKHIFRKGNENTAYISANSITSSFRSKVKNMAKDIETMQYNLQKSNPKVQSILIYSANKDQHLGIRLSKDEGFRGRTFSDIAKDSKLMSDISEKLKDKDFRVAIAIGESKFDSTTFEDQIKSTQLDDMIRVDALKEDKDKQFKFYSIKDIQGSEADYVLSYIPSEFFKFNFSDWNKQSDPEKALYQYKTTLFKTLLGRAKYFSDVAMDDTAIAEIRDGVINKVANETDNLRIEPQEYKAAFKKDWGEKLVESILYTEGDTTDLSTKVTESAAEVTPSTIVNVVEKQTIDNEGSGLLIPINTHETIKVPITDKSLQVVNEVGSDNQLKQYYSRLLVDYDSVLNNMPNFSDASEKNISGLKAELKTMIDNNAADVTTLRRAKLLLNELNDLPTLITGNEKNADLISSINGDFGPKEKGSLIKTADPEQTDGEFMKQAQKEDHSIVVYQDIKDAYREDMSDDNLKLGYLRQVYGDNVLGTFESNRHINLAFKYEKVGEDDKFTVSDDYVYQLVTYTPKSKRFFTQNNILVAYPNGKENEKFIIGQLPPVGVLLEGPENNSTQQETLKNLLSKRVNLLDSAHTTEFDENKNKHIQFNKDKSVAYIETVLDPSIVKGLTVGNLTTGDSYSIDFVNNKNLLNKQFIKQTNKTVNTDFINNIKKFKKSGYENWNIRDNNFPLVPDGNGKLFFPYKDSHYIVVKTKKGNIPFLLDNRGICTPIIGADINGIHLIKSGTDSDLGKLSIALENIDKQFNKKYIGEKDSIDKISNNINMILEINPDVLDAVNISRTSEIARNILNRNFSSKKSLVLSDIKLTLEEAKSIWEQTGRPASYSEPKVIMEGEHAGKAVVFYTFRSPESLNLDNMSSEELINLYEKINTEKNNNTTSLSNNRLGVGMLLLDIDGKTLTETVAQHPKELHAVTSAAHMNKVIMSGEGQNKFITLLAAVHAKLTNTPAEIIGELLSKNNVKNLSDYKHDDIINSWIKENQNKPGFEVMKALSEQIFSPESLGSIVVTHAVDSDTRGVLYQVRKIKEHYQDDILSETNEKEILDDTSGIYSNVKSDVQFLITKLFHSNEDLMNKVGLSLNQLFLVTSTEGGEPGATGSLALDANGRILVEKSKYPIVTAISEKLVNVINDGIGSLIPEPQFNMYSFVEFINDLQADGRINATELKESLTILDDLLLKTEFPNGIFVSPNVLPTSSILGNIESTKIGGERFITDVKRIKKPQIVLDSSALTRTLSETDDGVSSIADVKKDVIKTVDAKIKDPKEIIEERLVAASSRNHYEDVIDSINKMVLTSTEKSDLIEKTNIQFYNNFPIPTEIPFQNINFEDHFLTTTGTESFIKTLNSLRDISINQNVRDLVFKNLLQIPDAFTNSQRYRLAELTSENIKDAIKSDKQSADKIRSIYESDLLNNITLVEQKVSEESMFNNVKNLVTEFRTEKNQQSYPTTFDMSVENRSLLLLGLHTVEFEKGLEKVFTDDQVNASLTNKINSIGYPKLWLKRALDFENIKAFKNSDVPLSKPEVEALFNQDNLLKLDAQTISHALYKLSNQEDLSLYREFLSKFSTDFNNISYNKDIKQIGLDLIKEAAEKVQMNEKDMIDTQLESLKSQLHELNPEIQQMKQDVNEIKDTLIDVTKTKLNDENQMHLNNLLKTLNEDTLYNISKLMDGKLNPEEDYVASMQLTKIIAESIIPNESKVEIIDALENIAAERNPSCF